jgi:Protein of unknown function (DUF732)
MKMKLPVAAMLAGVALLMAPLAHAAPTAAFLRQLDADGISGPSDALLTAARGTCDMLDTETGDKVSQYVFEQTGLDEQTSNVFVADAIYYFCPWQDHSGGMVWQSSHPGQPMPTV